MLITGWNAKRDRTISSVEKLLSKYEAKGVVTEATLEESGGMGSYETFYVCFEKDDQSFTIRYSGHSASCGNPDFALWNDDFQTVSQLKKALIDCFNKAK